MTEQPHPRHVAAPAEAILDEVERAVVGKRAVLEIDVPALRAGSRDAATRLWALRRAAMRTRLTDLGATTVSWDGERPLESVVGEVIAFRRASRLAARG